MKFSLVLIALVLQISIHAQSEKVLETQIKQIIESKNLSAGISIKNIEDQKGLNINGNNRMPMMSVFKFHIALAVLHQVDQGKLKLNHQFFIKKEDLLPNTWSPIREEFPDGNINLTLNQLLRYTVSHSDNNGCDILLKIIGGTETVQKFINKQGIKDFVIKVNEADMNWENQYWNVTTANATNKLLEKFFKGKVLTKENTQYLYQIMVETSRGLTWMKAGLPKDIELAHRTGLSNTNASGLRAAMNDVGIFKLPNGKHIILSVYFKNIMEDREVTEKTIAEIAKATFDFYNKKVLD